MKLYWPSLVLGSSISTSKKRWPSTQKDVEFILHGDANLFNMPVIIIYIGVIQTLWHYICPLYLITDHCGTCENIYNICSNLRIPVGDGDPLLLISDPLSLNINRPRQVSQLVRHHISNFLIEITENKHLKSLFSESSEQEDLKLCDYLLDSRPCYPRVLHEIMRLTVTGTRLCIISKFSNTRTIFHITNMKIASKFIKDIFKLKEKFIMIGLLRVNRSIILRISVLMFLIAQHKLQRNCEITLGQKS